MISIHEAEQDLTGDSVIRADIVVFGDASIGLMPGVNPTMEGNVGDGDRLLQSYCYRMVLTDVPSNRVTIEKPAEYDESEYEILFRAIEAGQDDLFFKTSAIPNRKTDSNNASGISCDSIGRNYGEDWDWTTLSNSERERVAARHRDRQLGLVWTLQNHPRVPAEICERYSSWGLPADGQALAAANTRPAAPAAGEGASARLNAEDARPGWRLSLRLPDGEIEEINSARLAGATESSTMDPDGATSLVWNDLGSPLAKGITVTMKRTPVEGGAAWRLDVANSGEAALWEVVFPDFQTQVHDDDTIVLPNVSGRIHPANEPLDYVSVDQQHYPSGVLSMQCIGLYGRAGGVYIGTHDPTASRKGLEVTCGDGRLEVRWRWPVPDMGKQGTSWEQPGDLVIRSFEGDWFDVAQIYRAWVSKEAQWWPRGARAGRPDTPDWLKKSPFWIMSNGPWPYRDPPLPMDQAAAKVERLVRFMDDIPCAVHMYNWHQVPYDTELPHYFPAKPGFSDAVRRLQALGVHVMPYINAHVWDMATEEFEDVARPAAVKADDGSIPTKSYAGNTFAPMCPATRLWRDTVQDLVRRLIGPEYGVDGVYLDQIAAQNAELCFDEGHGHPVGGGSWWTSQGNWPLLEELRAAAPDTVLTSESSAEPYVNRIDGYLTWGGFRNGDRGVPLFHAVYAGQVELFGRLYKMDTWKGTALHTKAAQALVWGEQIGWITPDVVDHPSDAAFLKRLARTRRNLPAYLGRGRMARPPRLQTDGEMLTENWVFASDVIVTVPATTAGAWLHETGRAVVLILVNADASSAHTVRLEFDAATYGLGTDLVIREWVATDEPADLPDPIPTGAVWDRAIELSPLEIRAIEIGDGGTLADHIQGAD